MMRRFIFFILFSFLASPIIGFCDLDMDEQYEKAKAEASRLLQESGTPSGGKSLEDVLGFVNSKPSESHLNIKDIKDRPHQIRQNPVKDTSLTDLDEIINNAGRFEEEDAGLSRNSGGVIENSEHVLRNTKDGKTRIYGKEEALSHNGKRKLCFETKANQQLTCERNLLEPEIDVINQEQNVIDRWERQIPSMSADNRRHMKPKIMASFPSYPVYKKIKVRAAHIKELYWIQNCQGLEELVRQGSCRKIKTICPAGDETRILDGQSIKRCWRKIDTFECNIKSEQNCQLLRQKGCEQIDSTCAERVNDGYGNQRCIRWQQVMSCQQDKEVLAERTQVKTPEIYGLDLKEEDEGQDNDELANVATQLTALSEMKSSLPEDLNQNSPVIFKGQSLHCRKEGFFKDCCKNKGLGLDWNLAGCDAQEKQLAAKKNSGLCHVVGTYKIKSNFIKKALLRPKKQSACCFSSKLARNIHEQGRRQIGKGWGDPKHPQCGGFTPAEIARVDFSRIDLSEVYAETLSRMKAPDRQKIDQRLKQRLNQFATDLQPKPVEVTKK